MAKKRNHYSGIGGQAVLEGVMMKNKEKYAVAVRKSDGKISIEQDNYHGLLDGNVIKKIPFIRGIFNFIDSLVLGMKCLNYSASMYEEEDEENDKSNGKSGFGDKLMTTLVTCVSLAMAIGIFVVLPYFLASKLNGSVRDRKSVV